MTQIEQFQIQYNKNELNLLELNKICNILLEELSMILSEEKKEHDLFSFFTREKIKELLIIIQEVNEMTHYRKEKGFFKYKDLSWKDVSTHKEIWRNEFNDLIIPLNSNCSFILVDELIISCQLEKFQIANEKLKLTVKDLSISDNRELQNIDLNKILYDNYKMEQRDLSLGKYKILLHYIRKRMSENHFYSEDDMKLLDTITTKIENILTCFFKIFDRIIESKTDHS